ncbi:MAG: hypothetical protein AAGN35_18140 [Bacteroidota bacterium]
MRQTCLITACAFAILLSFLPLRGQNNIFIAFDSTNWLAPNPVGIGDSVMYTFDVSHNLATAYMGPVDIMAQVGGGTPFSLFSTSMETIPAGIPGKSYTLTDTVTLARYGGGINIVVVWPTAPNFVTLDTAFGELTVLPTSVIDPQLDRYPLRIYPNPTARAVRIRTQFPPVLVEETRLCDQQGRVLFRQDGVPIDVSLEGMTGGLYFLEIQLMNGALRRFKILKRD